MIYIVLREGNEEIFEKLLHFLKCDIPFKDKILKIEVDLKKYEEFLTFISEDK